MSAMAKLDLSFLRQRFVAGLERRTRELGGLVELLSIVQDDPETTSHAMRAFHSLAGIGGTYGYGEITAIARSAETTCVRALEEGTSLDPREVAQLIGAVSAIREMYAAITGQAGTGVAR